ncbi:MAG: hypothetical protein KGJ78_07650 [Alphaproteobacteria bacterium]|nr:hypothetical protein [Alphaproteobacteria bacterium]
MTTPDGELGMSFDVLAAKGVTPEDIDEKWLDDMVKRLFRELKRELSQMESSRPATGIDQAHLRAANARALASLERTLERLACLERQRVLIRETKVMLNHVNARQALECRLDQRLAAIRALPAPERIER